ncbi:PAS domain S-box protein [Flavobacterium olei]|uniref:PAS domain S-box protein n=1 Tax=Flavobacterium olei TaxID=1886782 RepID=UPI0032195C11
MKIKTLIVEQDHAAVEAIQYALQDSDIICITETASSEKEYETAIRNFKPDLIICNYASKGQDGISFFTIQKQLAPQTPFIFIAQSITVEEAIALIRIGIYDVIEQENLTILAGSVKAALYKKSQSDVTIPERLALDFAKILDLTMDLVCCCDENGSLLYVNKAVANILGYNDQELIGTNYKDLLFEKDCCELDTVDIPKKSEHSDIPEKRFLHKNGSSVCLLWSVIWDQQYKVNYCIGRDITEKKNIEKAFEIERRRFYNLYSQAPSCMGIIKGPNHVYELANELFLQLIGKKDIIGKTVKEVLPELGSQGIFEILDEVYLTGKPFSANEMLIQLDRQGNGTLTDAYLNFIYQAHRDVDNHVDGILFFANDVTEQVISRKKIEEREKMYRDLIDKSPVATYSCDADGRILTYNKAAAVLWGREPEIGKDLWYDSWNIYNNKSMRKHSLGELIAELEEEHSNLGREIIIERPNGDKRNVLPYPVPFRNDQGVITGAVIVLADLTEVRLARQELRKSEKKYRHLFDNNPMSMWVIDLKTFKFLDVNKMAILQYGYTREEFLSMTALDIRPLDDQQHFIKSSDPSKINGSNYNRGKWNHLKKNGTIIPVEIVAHDIKYEGSPARLILSNDITERIQAEKNLEKRNRDLIKTNSELDKFVYSVSHDLRSPLTSILGLLAFIETESQEADTLFHVGLIRTSVNRLDEFVKNILSYSRNNRRGLEVEQIPLQQTILEVVDSLQGLPQAKGINYQVNIKEIEPFYSDGLRLNTVLENLISNAIKYHRKEESGRFIKINGYSDDKGFQFTIQDNGIGIAEQYHQKIYEMFFRLSGKQSGSGIGLYIVKDALEILQGSITLQSQEGMGTTFTIALKNLKP